MSNSLRPHGQQHVGLPFPSQSPGVCSNSCPLSQWYHPTISPPWPPSPAFNLSQHQGLFQWVGSSHQVPKVLGLQFQHQSLQRVLGLISFRIDWFDLLAVQVTFKSLLQHHNSKASILRHLAFFNGPTLTSIHDYWKNHRFDYMDLCQQSDVSVF